ncbi:hypothetical protein SYK_31100 [Pseudodesulfovibrio nedwellii]|uniref:SnoaL-like domain-containing protein n=1 Tax=Pseudodesulfovibrio nedwellii TaxID=2973072 RepID=A0ABN6SAB1_9BACT|nr:hypothetical protein [Pseudodesulfovibrio nedwellii]BDQ38750.1 hypothetical protein SYK_31100 [Pseudodesulfovibrio nedwellii]
MNSHDEMKQYHLDMYNEYVERGYVDKIESLKDIYIFGPRSGQNLDYFHNLLPLVLDTFGDRTFNVIERYHHLKATPLKKWPNGTMSVFITAESILFKGKVDGFFTYRDKNGFTCEYLSDGHGRIDRAFKVKAE